MSRLALAVMRACQTEVISAVDGEAPNRVVATRVAIDQKLSPVATEIAVGTRLGGGAGPSVGGPRTGVVVGVVGGGAVTAGVVTDGVVTAGVVTAGVVTAGAVARGVVVPVVALAGEPSS